MPYDRAAILRTAHAAAAQRMLPTRAFDYSLDWCRDKRLYVQPLSYRRVLAQELRKAWNTARPIRLAPSLLTQAEAADVASLRYRASVEPLTARGAIAFRAAHDAATAIAANAARRAA